MVFDAKEFADMLLNHPSHWKILEFIKHFPKEIASHMLEKHELEMKHVLELSEMEKQREQALEIVASRTEKLSQVQNELGIAKKLIKEKDVKISALLRALGAK